MNERAKWRSESKQTLLEYFSENRIPKWRIERKDLVFVKKGDVKWMKSNEIKWDEITRGSGGEERDGER